MKTTPSFQDLIVAIPVDFNHPPRTATEQEDYRHRNENIDLDKLRYYISIADLLGTEAFVKRCRSDKFTDSDVIPVIGLLHKINLVLNSNGNQNSP
jgi:hypothetical protein